MVRRRVPCEGRRGRRGERGFTMAELLVTMLLLTVVLLGLVALQVSTLRQVTVSKRAAEATRLAERVINRFRVMQASAIADTGGAWIPVQLETPTGVAPMDNIGPDGIGNGPFTVRHMVEDPGNGSRLITVRVAWTDVNRNTQATGTGYQQFIVTLSTQRYP